MLRPIRLACLASLMSICAVAACAGAAERADKAWQVLTEGLSRGTTHRTQAVAALGAVGASPRVVQLLEWALGDPEPPVREIAAATLGNVGAKAAIPRLRQALGDEHPEVSFAAANALATLGDPGAREVFLEILAGERSDTHEGISGMVHDARKRFRDKRGLANLGFKEAAGFALGPFAMGIPLAEDIVGDESASARAFAADALGRDADPASLKALQGALDDKSWIVRAAAAKALARRNAAAALPRLQTMMENPDEKQAVRYMAAAAVVRITGESPSPAESAVTVPKR